MAIPCKRVSIEGDSGEQGLIRGRATEGGTVEVSLRREAHTLLISVRDEGIGIPDNDQLHLFEAFHRASNVGKISGTGLGLVIVKQAVEAHNGTITVDSTLGEGTTFVVTIPVIPVEE